jgi:hypothetical protein
MIPIADSIAPIKNNNGAIAGAVLVFRDATQQRLVQEQNRALERARQLEYDIAELQCLDILHDDRLSTASYELPISPAKIKLAVRILETILDQQGLLSSQFCADATVIARYWQIVQEQGKQKLKLVNDLLDIRAIETEVYPLQLTLIQVPDWLPELIQPFAAWAQFQQQQLHIDIAPNLPPLVSDQLSLTRILKELLNNAFQYTPAGENIGVTVRVLGDGNVETLHATSLRQGKNFTVEIQVSNSGVEIPPEEQAKIFEPFYRIPSSYFWKQGGTGLGLTVVKTLVHRLQGEIDVTSDRDGTRFTILIPNLQSQGMEVEDDYAQ